MITSPHAAVLPELCVCVEAGGGRRPELLPHRDQTDGGEIHRDPGVYREGARVFLLRIDTISPRAEATGGAAF